MATNQRLSQLSVEVLSSGSGDARLSQLSVEVLSAGEQGVLRVTQTGAQTLQQSGELAVTQTGAHAIQQKGEVFVTQIGLLILYGGDIPEEPPSVNLIDCPHGSFVPVIQLQGSAHATYVCAHGSAVQSIAAGASAHATQVSADGSAHPTIDVTGSH